MCRQEPDIRVFFAIDFISYTFYPLDLYRRDVCLIMNLFQLSLSIHKTLVTASHSEQLILSTWSFHKCCHLEEKFVFSPLKARCHDYVN